METTALYVDYIIIGIETFSWIVVLFAAISNGFDTLKRIVMMMDSLGTTVLLVGALYILGIILDRLADMIFKKREKSIRKEYNIQAESSILVWEKHDQLDFQSRLLMKNHMLRATTINVPILTVSLFIFIVRFYLSWQYIIFAFLLGLVATIISYKGTIQGIHDFYSKTRIVEKSEMQNA